ncbi:MAG: DMT family transporter [Sandaracinaceae bacterium]
MALRTLLYLLLLASLWGPSFFFIRLAVEDIPPITLVAGRMVGATALLYGLMRLRGGRLPRDPAVWRRFAFVALTGTAVPFVLVSWGEQFIDTALASILNATVPLFTLVLAHFFTADDRLTWRKGFGVLLGLLGTVLLIAPSVGEGSEVGVLGLLAVLVASLGYSVSGVYTRIHMRGMAPMVAPTMQFLISGVLLVPLSLAVDRPWTLAAPSPTAWGGFLALIVFGSVLAFVVYYRLLEIATASTISMCTYLIPVVGVGLGVSVLGETLPPSAYVASGAILLGVLVVNGLPRRA